jgi:predicted lipoprotein with Yx(FWY)xxD motif
MLSKKPAHLALTALLTLGLGVSTGATAAFAAPTKHTASAADKKKKKKKPTVKLGDSTFGKILVDAKTGKTLYAFTPDGTDTTASKCTGGCATIWPPLKGKARAGKGLDKAKLTIGGGGQLAYADHFLYMYSGDSAAGDTNGQGVADIWHVVNADGELITA